DRPGILEGHQIELRHRLHSFGIFLVDAEFDLLTPLRDVDGAEHPVPDRELRTVIAIAVRDRAAVVDLVHGWADHDPRQPGGEGQPDMAVAELRAQYVEGEPA